MAALLCRFPRVERVSKLLMIRYAVNAAAPRVNRMIGRLCGEDRGINPAIIAKVGRQPRQASGRRKRAIRSGELATASSHRHYWRRERRGATAGSRWRGRKESEVGAEIIAKRLVSRDDSPIGDVSFLGYITNASNTFNSHSSPLVNDGYSFLVIGEKPAN